MRPHLRVLPTVTPCFLACFQQVQLSLLGSLSKKLISTGGANLLKQKKLFGGALFFRTISFTVRVTKSVPKPGFHKQPSLKSENFMLLLVEYGQSSVEWKKRFWLITSANGKSRCLCNKRSVFGFS